MTRKEFREKLPKIIKKFAKERMKVTEEEGDVFKLSEDGRMIYKIEIKDNFFKKDYTIKIFRYKTQEYFYILINKKTLEAYIPNDVKDSLVVALNQNIKNKIQNLLDD